MKTSGQIAAEDSEFKSITTCTLTSSLRSRLRAGISWNLVAAGFNQGSTFLISIVLARMLGRTTFGEYAMVLSTLWSMALLAQMATGLTATRYLAEFRSTDKVRAGRIMGLCSVAAATLACIVGLAFIGSAPWLASYALKAPQLSIGLMIGAGYMLFSVINGYQTGALAGLEAYPLLAKAGSLSGCLNVALCSLGAWRGGLNGAIIGITVSSLFGCLIHRRFLKNESARQGITPTYRQIFAERSVLTKFALPAGLTGFIMIPATWLGNAILARQPGGYGELALYSAALNLRVFAVFLPRNMDRVIFSLMSNYLGMGDEKRFRKTFWINIAINCATVMVVGGALVLLGQRVLRIYGHDFQEGYPVLVILMVAAFIEALAMAVYQVIKSLEKMWLSLFGVMLPSYATLLALAYFLAPKFGARGLALAYAANWGVNLLVTSLWVMKFGTNIKTK